MKPVEIEFLMRDDVTGGTATAGSSESPDDATAPGGPEHAALGEEGFAKERAAAQEAFEQRKQRIDAEERQQLELHEKLRTSGAGISSVQKVAISAQASAQRIQAAHQYDTAQADITKREQQALNELLAKYRDFEAQRAAIKKQGDADIAALEALRTEENAREIDRAIAEARKRMQQGLQALNDTEARSLEGDNDFLKQIFGDYSMLSSDTLKNLFAQAGELQQHLSGEGTAEGITFLSPDELDKIKKSPAELDRLRKALDKLLKTGSSGAGNKWEGIFRTLDTGLDKLGKAKSFEQTSEAIHQIGSAAADAAGALAAMFEQMGESQIAESLNGIQQVMSAVSNIAQGFAKGEVVGGIGAAVGEAMNFLGQAFAAQKRHKKALKEIEQAKLDFQRKYNLALLEQNLLFEQGTNIFGERQIASAANAVKNYREALAELQSQMKGDKAPKMTWIERVTGDIMGTYAARKKQYDEGIYGLASKKIVTGHKKTGLFGWGKGKDTYSSILSVYKDLVKENGELDTVMLKTILDTRKMSGETRKYLEYLLELEEAMDEADKALEEYLQQTFGSLGNGLLDSITAALAGGDAALTNFAGNVASVFEDLGKQVAYSLFFADLFDQLEQELKQVYGSGKSEDQIANDAMQVIDSFYNSIGSNVDAAQAWLEEWRRKAGEMGYNLWQGDGSGEGPVGTTQSGRAGAFTTLTQEQGTKLEGLMTSLQLHGASLDEKMDNVTASLGGSLDALHHIARNTDTLPVILSHMQAIKRDGIKIK